MIRVLRLLSVFMAVGFFVSGCSTLSTISSTQPDVSIRVMEKPHAPMPVKEELSVRTFGSYHFVAEKTGADPLYGVIPLHVNVGYIILDALFFAPLTLINARGAYPFYEIDYEKAIIRYSDDGQNWDTYNITSEESDYAKIYYNDLNKKAP
jgi:hypothetical protein